MKNLIFISFLSLLILSCSNNTGNNNVILPDAIGGADEVMLILNDEFLTNNLSKEIKKTLVDQYKILPQSQARFLISSVKYSKVNSLLKRFINPIFVITKNEKTPISSLVNSLLTDSEKSQAKKGEKTIFFKKNLWAKNQSILIIIAENEKDILNALKQKKNDINNYYDETNIYYYEKLAYIDGVNQSLKKQFKEYHNIDFNVPVGYVLAKNENNFVLLRKDVSKCTLFLSIDINNYNAEVPINNLGIDKFDSLGLFIDGEKKDSYVIADTTLGFDIQKSIKGNVTTFENAGLWIMENDFVGGGPFINQYIIDNENNRVIYLSGMVYGPAEKNKKKYMRQFEAIFNSLKILK